jgi:Large polyvalent protein associated domain 23
MNDQFPPAGWFMRPETWPYWMPNLLTGARTLPKPPTDVRGSAWLEKAPGGILGNLARPFDETWSNTWAATTSPWPMPSATWSSFPALSWGQKSAHLPHATAIPNQLPAKPRPPLYGPGDVLLPAPELEPPPPPKDLRTWLRDALSDENVRYYAGPHLYEALRKLHALTQLLPGSGTVQSTQDASFAGEEAKAGNYDKAAAHLGLGTLNAALDWLPPAKLAIIAGTMAKTFPWGKLSTAMKMEAAGKSAEEIWRATGLERAADGRWTFEIPDKGYQVNPNAGKRVGPGSLTLAPLYEHHAHPGMQEAYPGLANWQSRLSISPFENPRGSTNVNRNRLTVYAPSLEWARRIGIHELKHAIDDIEKHPPGGSPQQFMEMGIPEREAYDIYHRLVGEVAARNAQKRLDWGDQIRSLRRPAATEDVPRDRQINLYDLYDE